MSRLSSIKVALLVLALVSFLQGCGGGSSGGGGGGDQPTTLTLTTKPTSLAAGSQTTFQAFIDHNHGNFAGANWTLTTNSGQACTAACGALSGYTNSGSSGNGDTTTIVYTAPTQIPNPNSITITATSIANTSSSDSDTFTLTEATPPSVTTTSLPAATINVAYASTALSATGGATPYSWSITSGALPPGMTLTNGAIAGTPTSIGTFNFTVTVTDANHVTATGNLSITVGAPALAVSTTSLPGGTINVAYTSTNLNATGGVPPYSWSVTSGALPPGMTLTSGAIAGTPTSTGTYNFTVTVTDSTFASATGNFTITVASGPVAACATNQGNEALLDGEYAFLLQGFDITGSPMAVAGTITADGKGGISSGEEDLNTNSGNPAQNLPVTPSGSLYGVGSDSRGCLQLTTSAGVSSYRFALGSIASGVAGAGKIITFDSSGTGAAGVIEKQDPTAFSTAQINGNYAFGLSSGLAGGGSFASAGTFTASNGTISAGAADQNKNGTLDGTATNTYPATPLAFTGTYSVDSSGRGTVALTFNGNPRNAIFYVVSAGELLLMGTDAQSTNPLMAGKVLQQSGSFSNASLNGISVRYLAGISSSTTSTKAEAGFFQTDGAGNFTYTPYLDDGGGCADITDTGTYSVAANGRVTIAGSGFPAVFYLVNQNQGFVVSASSDVSFGAFEPQTGGPFSNTTLSGSFALGTVPPVMASGLEASGVASFDGSGNWSSTTDQNSATFTPTPNQAFSGTYTVNANGQGPVYVSGTFTNYLLQISPSKVALVTCGSGYPAVYLYQK